MYSGFKLARPRPFTDRHCPLDQMPPSPGKPWHNGDNENFGGKFWRRAPEYGIVSHL
jgi:hypothetical protein